MGNITKECSIFQSRTHRMSLIKRNQIITRITMRKIKGKKNSNLSNKVILNNNSLRIVVVITNNNSHNSNRINLNNNSPNNFKI